LAPSGNDRTYDVKGGKDISVIGGEEKRAFAACLGSAADGTILPFSLFGKERPLVHCQKVGISLRSFSFAMFEKKNTGVI
jgi:hypothetical protein